MNKKRRAAAYLSALPPEPCLHLRNVLARVGGGVDIHQNDVEKRRREAKPVLPRMIAQLLRDPQDEEAAVAAGIDSSRALLQERTEATA